jgi:Condensin II complex subunit CAP-H2 or CNDH2, C-term
VHHSGALLLEARDGFMLDEFLHPITRDVAATQIPTAFAQALPLTIAASPAAIGNGEAPQDDDCDDGGAMGGDYFDGAGDDFLMEDAAPLPNESPTALEVAQAGDEPQKLISNEEEEEEEEEFDPYAPLDPCDTGSMLSKPFKKYSRLPTKPKMRAAQQPPAAHVLADGLLLLPAPATGLLFPEFNYALHQSQLEDARETRKLTREAFGARHQNKKSNNSTATAVFTIQEAEEALAAAGAEDEDNILEDNDPGFFDDQIDAGIPDEDDFEGAFGDAAGDGGDGSGWGYGHGLPLSDLLYGNNNSDGEISYEDLCRAHVESLISAAAAAEVQTELASRVSTWRTKMAPVLEEEDARPEFDIHYYGERILQGLAQLSVSDTTNSTLENEEEEADANENPAPSRNNKKRDAKNKNRYTDDASLAPALTGPVDFDEIVTGAEIENDYDVPRLFSSMLHLVNNGNLRVIKIRDSSDDFKISLLSTELKHKRIEAYLAPSSAAAEAEAESQGMNAIEVEEEEEMIASGGTGKNATSKRRKA